MRIINYTKEFNAVFSFESTENGVVTQEKVVKPMSSFTESRITIETDGVFIQLLEISRPIKLWDSFAEATLTEEGIKARLKEVLEDK